jgi:hypothetical protein
MGLYDTVAGYADHATGSVDESIGRQFDDQEGGGLGDQAQDFLIVTDDPAQDDFTVTGTPRRFVDSILDYDTAANGQYVDSVDLPGPSFSNDLDFSEGVLGFDWRNPRGAGDDPTNPDNWGAKTKLLIAAVVAMVALVLLRPLLQLGANASEVAA